MKATAVENYRVPHDFDCEDISTLQNFSRNPPVGARIARHLRECFIMVRNNYNQVGCKEFMRDNSQRWRLPSAVPPGHFYNSVNR